MKERPILFSAPMVRALLDGSKTQTRRVLSRSLQNPGWTEYVYFGPSKNNPNCQSMAIECGPDYPDGKEDQVLCPYGAAGDRLWVRENGWERPERTPKMMREGADTWAPYYFDADGLSASESAEFKECGFKRRPSIHMPRAFSRIDLEVTGVRVERLQDISATDAIAEGISLHPDHHHRPDTSLYGPVQTYRDLWEQINGAGSWYLNPWVWVVEFRMIRP